MRQIININKGWFFSKGRISDIKKDTNNSINIDLPHTWNNIDGQDGGEEYYRGTCTYRRHITKGELPPSDLYYLEFNGANASSDVYIDGKHIAHHNGGYSTWRVNITDYISDNHFLQVEVDNGKNDSVYPQMADFTFYGGLYRDVNIIAVNKTHFDLDYYGTSGIKVTPTVKDNTASVLIQVFITDEKDNSELVYQIKDKNSKVIYERISSVKEKEELFEIENVHLWNGVDDPYLYTAEVLLKENNELVDRVSTRFGCRSFKVDPDRGFILNGREYPLRGVARHQDRWEVGNALSKKHHKEDMDLICEMGANTIRLAHYQHDQYFYDLCDERGIVVWAEIPYISSHMPKAKDNTISQMKELIIQNYNHPSIVVWGLSNEITIGKCDEEELLNNHKMLNDLAHDMDKTRLTAVAALSMCDPNHPYLKIPDVVSYNHYFGWYVGDTSMNGQWLDEFHKNHPDMPIGLSEYGCEALNWHTSDPKMGDYTEEYQAYYHEELIKQLYTRPYLWATHAWNMFDFAADSRNEGGEAGQNHKGLVTFDRKYKKDSFYAYKAWLSKEPFVHICGKRYINRVEDITKVTVYSNLDKVELFVNDKSLGIKESSCHFFYFDVPNVGKSTIVAKAGECIDESYIIKVDEFDENYRLKEEGAILNWFDITEVDGYYSLNDDISTLTSSPDANLVVKRIINLIGMRSDGEISNMLEGFEDKIDMIGSFTIIKLLNMIKVDITKEELLEFNSQLNKIKKVG